MPHGREHGEQPGRVLVTVGAVDRRARLAHGPTGLETGVARAAQVLVDGHATSFKPESLQDTAARSTLTSRRGPVGGQPQTSPGSISRAQTRPDVHSPARSRDQNPPERAGPRPHFALPQHPLREAGTKTRPNGPARAHASPHPDIPFTKPGPDPPNGPGWARRDSAYLSPLPSARCNPPGVAGRNPRSRGLPGVPAVR